MYVRYLTNFSTERISSSSAFDVLIIGSGIAGLFTSIKAAQRGLKVGLLTKSWEESNTKYAQGGIAAAFNPVDSPEQHLRDTVEAGAGLCDEQAVDILVQNGPKRVKELIELGTHFDKLDNGDFALTREGGHRQDRVLHSYGDQTGLELANSLQRVVLQQGNITVLKKYFAVDLLTHNSKCYGVIALDNGGDLSYISSSATVIATGGVGQLYSHTTNPDEATADGIAMAYRAGAELMNMEFVQFHPTALALENAPTFLISEAVRGEGGILKNISGERFMPHYHAHGELAPRDIVAKAMVREMEKEGSNHLYLDVTHLTNLDFGQRFPTIYDTLLDYGVDCYSDFIPVAPAAHYFMGGIKTDYEGRTSISGLYACGEVACCGLHGANRLASNSLLDAIVFGSRVAEAIHPSQDMKPPQDIKICYNISRSDINIAFASVKRTLQRTMWQHAGLVRSETNLLAGLQKLGELSPFMYQQVSQKGEFEVMNLLMVAGAVMRSALWRKESRGGHFRTDFPRPIKEWNVPSLLRR